MKRGVSLIMFNHVPNEFDVDLVTENINGKRHYVTPSGDKYPSITTVLSIPSREGIKAWRARVGEETANAISTKAARRGTNVHYMCEDYINNELNTNKFLPNEKELFYSIKPLIDNHINNIHAQEVTLYSDYLRVAGRVDLIAEFDGKLSIIDFKTSNKRKKKEWISNYFQQTSAYAVMYEERTKIPVSQIVVLIAVENDHPQLFIEKRDDHIWDCVDTIGKYYDEQV